MCFVGCSSHLSLAGQSLHIFSGLLLRSRPGQASFQLLLERGGKLMVSSGRAQTNLGSSVDPRLLLHGVGQSSCRISRMGHFSEKRCWV